MYVPTHPRVAEAAVVFLRPVLRGAVDVAACIRDSSARGGRHRLGAYAVVDGPTSLVECVPKHRPMLRRAIVARSGPSSAVAIIRNRCFVRALLK